MEQRLGPELIQRIIDLITPFMGIDDRHAYIDPWCVSFPNLYKQIDWAGPAQAFTARVVTLFLRYGFVMRDKTAIEFLLESVRGSMGIEDQYEIDAILREIRESKASPAPRPQSTEAPPSRRSCTLMITFVSMVFSAIIVIVVWSSINPLAEPASTETPISMAMSDLTRTATATRLPTNTPTVIPTETLVVGQTPTMHIILVPTSMNKPAETSTAIPPTPTLIAIAPTSTTSPVVEPTVPSTLTETSTPIAVSPAKSVCLSIIGYKEDEIEKLKQTLIEQAGFDNQLDELRFYNHEDKFAEVCVMRQ